MGFRGICSADMHFDDVTVPAENLIVPAGGFRQLMEAFDLERCGNTTMSLAIAQSAFDYVLAMFRSGISSANRWSISRPCSCRWRR